jgi:hypothetical protein
MTEMSIREGIDFRIHMKKDEQRGAMEHKFITENEFRRPARFR